MKITFVNKNSYAEESQPNPLRWAILSGSPETGFINETSWLKCKDFFNDYAVAYNGGKRFVIYGFDTRTMTIPEKGKSIYIAVDATTKAFPFNLGQFNSWLKDQNLPTIVFQPYEGKWLLEFDPFFFKNTYNISLVSLIIRLMNIDKEFTSFQEAIDYKEYPSRDQGKWKVAVDKGMFFKLPQKYEPFTWFINEETNSKATPEDYYSYSSLVHNNGLISWTQGIK